MRARRRPGSRSTRRCCWCSTRRRTSRRSRTSTRSPRPAPARGCSCSASFRTSPRSARATGERAPTIVNNHRAKVFGTGISDPETLSYVSRVVGAGEFEQRSRSTGEKGRDSETEGDTYRDLAPANVVRERQPGTGLLVYGHLPPAKIRLRPWYEEKALRELGAGAERRAPRGRRDSRAASRSGRRARSHSEAASVRRPARRRALGRTPSLCVSPPSGSRPRNEKRGCAWCSAGAAEKPPRCSGRPIREHRPTSARSTRTRR